MAKRTQQQSNSSAKILTPNPLSLWLERIIVGLFHILFFTVPLFFLVVNEELFEFNKMILTYGITVMIVTAWICKMISDKRFIWRRTPLDVPFVIFFASQVLSTLFSLHMRTSLFGYYTRFHGGLLSTLTYLTLFYAYVSVVKKKYQPALFRTILFSGILVALYAIPEHFGYSPSCIIITGNFDVACWIQDVQTRVFATFGQPNWLAAYTVMVIPLAASMFLSSSTLKSTRTFLFKTVFPIAACLLLLLTLLYTKSRSGVLAFGVGSAVFLMMSVFAYFKNHSMIDRAQANRLQIQAFTILSIFGLIVLVVGTPFTPAFTTVINRSETPTVVVAPDPSVNRLDIGGTDSGEIRKIVWQGAIDVWKRYPLLGSGVETFAYSYFTDRPMAHNLVSEWDFLYNKAHNEFLNYLATTGIVGLGSYLFLHAALCWMLFSKFRASNSLANKLLYTALFSGLISIHISNFFGFSTVMVSILMYLFPAFALTQESAENTQPTISKLSESQWIGILITVGIGSYLLVMVYLMWYADYLYALSKAFFNQTEYEASYDQIQQAIRISPHEGLLYELKSKIASQYTIALVQEDQMDAASQMATEALDASDTSLMLNPVHLNFYKTRVQVLLTLAQAQPDFYQEALSTLELASYYAPTDPKLIYNQGVIYGALDDLENAERFLQRAVEMKPNYEPARYQLGQILERQSEFSEAAEHYQYILDHITTTNDLVRERLEVVSTYSAELE